MTHWVLAVLVLAALFLGLFGALRRAALWRRGRPAPVPLLGGLLAMPRRFLVDLHHVVARDPYMANTHVAVAGGFVASMILILIVHVAGLDRHWLVWLLLAALSAMFVGALFVARRRLGDRPPRLSSGPWDRLPKSLLAFSAGFLMLTLPAAGILSTETWGWLGLGLALLLVIWGLAETLFGMGWAGPMKHALAGTLHLAFHPRPTRFGGGRSTDLLPLDLDAPRLGVEAPQDFAWNRLLGFDACVQCGRCEAACPAYAAGQPLNPKKLVQDLVVGLSGPGSDSGYAGNHHPGRSAGQASGAPANAIVPRLITAETLWACTTCRACVYECPMMIEHVDAVVEMRRFLTLEKGQTAGKGPQLLEQLRATDNPNGNDPAARTHWAADLNIPTLAAQQSTDLLLWAGDGAFDLRSQRTLRALVKVLREANVDFAYLGAEELDCGDVARRLGDEATFADLARRNIATLSRYTFRRIVTTDPHALHSLRNEYPAFGGRFNVIHHSALLAELLQQGCLVPKKPIREHVTYHDPCYLGRYNGETQAPRTVLEILGVTTREMERHGMRSRCCGGGGGAPVTDIPGERRIPDIRIEDARATGAGLVAVACPNCAVMLEGVVQPRPEVRDLVELLADSLGV
jgi:Fe-S oxidoreductase